MRSYAATLHPDTLAPALDGITAVFLFAAPGSAAGFLAAAQRSGVRCVVLLSSAAVRDDVARQTNAIGAFHKEIERAIEETGLEWTFIRPGAFAANAVSWVPRIRAEGVVRGAYGAATSAPIHEQDIAAVATRALVSDGHVGATYVVTGPESLTQVNQVRLIGAAIGWPLRFEEVPADVARRAMVRHMPAAIVDALLDYQANSVGRQAMVSPTVEEVTGQPARTFGHWAIDHAADFQ